MKHIYLTAVLICCFITSFAQQFRIGVSAPQYKDGTTYLIYYYGKNLNIADSATFDASGKAWFEGEKDLSPGIYSIIFPGKRISYDFLVGEEKNIEIMVRDTANVIGSAVVSGSKENILFREYQTFVATQGTAMEMARHAYASAQSRADSVLHEQRYAALNKELNAYRERVISEYPQSLLAALLQAMKEPAVPNMSPLTLQDTLNNYRYYKNHYWDGITFQNPGIIRTPFFIPKLERYFRQVIDQHPDSVIREADYLLLLSRSSEPMYRFMMNWLTDEYYQPRVMGQDKVLVHLFEKYHSKGISSWLNEKQLQSITERAYMVMGNLIGEPAAPLLMTGTDGKETRLSDMNAVFSIVVFWDPTCGHCRTELPVLDSMYRHKWKQEGVKIFAVLTDPAQQEKWKAFIAEHKLSDWTHVFENEAQERAAKAAGRPSYRQLYDVIQTPTLYLLDEEKRIIAKKLSADQLDELIKRRIEMKVVR